MSEFKNGNILYGGPLPPIIGDNSRSLGEIVLKLLTENQDGVMFIDAANDIKLTRTQVRHHVIRLAKSLQALDVNAGDVIGICSENCLEYPILAYATFCLGATIAPLNVTYTDREINHTVNISRPKLIFVSSTAIGNVVKVAEKNTFIKNIILFDGNGENFHSKFVIAYSKLVSNYEIENCTDFNCKPIDMTNNVAVIYCSSGTTGLPKGVEITQTNMVVQWTLLRFNSVAELMNQSLSHLSNIMVPPCSHVYGFVVSVSISLCGDTIIILPKFEERLFLRTIEEFKPNCAALVPPLITFLAKSPLIDKYDLSSLKFLASGAAPLSKEVIEAVKKRLNLTAVLQGYGMSEMVLGVLTQKPGFDKSGSVGTLRFGAWGKVIDPETGKALGPNEHGEMCFKGDLIMRGYVRNPTATRETIDTEGWLHTGDIGYYDTNYEWFIVDRLKELIKYKGYQVPPAEIEAQLLTHPEIVEAAVIGIPDENAGELPMAVVVRKPNSQITEKDVIDFVAENASPAKRLHGGVKFVDVIPKNATGKILRRVLRENVRKNPLAKL